MTRASVLSTTDSCDPFGDVVKRRLRTEPIAHLPTKFHAALVLLVTCSVVKSGAKGIVRVLRQRFHQEHLKTVPQLRPHCCQSR